MATEDRLELDVRKISEELRIRPEIYVKILTSFSKTLFDKILALEEAVEKRDMEKIRRVLHEIKGTASNLRLTAVSEVEEAMHGEVKGAADIGRLNQGLQRMTAQAEKLRATVENIRL